MCMDQENYMYKVYNSVKRKGIVLTIINNGHRLIIVLAREHEKRIELIVDSMTHPLQH